MLFRQEHYGHHVDLQSVLDAVRCDPWIVDREKDLEAKRLKKQADAVAAVLANPSAFPVHGKDDWQATEFTATDFDPAMGSAPVMGSVPVMGSAPVMDFDPGMGSVPGMGMGMGVGLDMGTGAGAGMGMSVGAGDLDFGSPVEGGSSAAAAGTDDNWKVIEFDGQEEVPDCPPGDDNPCQ